MFKKKTKTSQAEYIWLDGTKPTQQLRCKTRVIEHQEPSSVKLDVFPDWGFDGSSTGQGTGNDSDRVLKPVWFTNDPIRGEGNFLVLCEVFNPDGTAHHSNTRSLLRHALSNGGNATDPWVGFEQEYTFFKNNIPLGWPENGYPLPQGPYYCGVGADKMFGREIVEAHTQACIDAGLTIFGTNAEVMPSQWEFQIGHRGFKNEEVTVLTVADQFWVARWLLHRIAEEFDVKVSFDNKPVSGDWNGAGCHTNFSTAAMRTKGSGYTAIEAAVKQLSTKHLEHVCLYGEGLDKRLTGDHETCNISEFRVGVADRGASIRIPQHVKQNGYGYLEDRRPGANCDPYLVCARMLTTVCGLDESVFRPYLPNTPSMYFASNPQKAITA